jgi:hypothetical protein
MIASCGAIRSAPPEGAGVYPLALRTLHPFNVKEAK